MRKKIIIGASLLLGLMVSALYLTSKISDAYLTAARKLLNDPGIAREFGDQHSTLLIGSSFRLGPERSCATLLFVVNGAKGAGIVEVLLRRNKISRDPWTVLAVTSGYYTRSDISCGSTT